MRFNKGSTYPVGECGMFSASIDDATGDGGKPWGSRIECYGKTAEEAETLRDLLLAAITEAAEHEKCNALDGTIDTTVAKVFELGQRYQRAADIPDHVACQAVEAELACLQLKQTRDVLMAALGELRDQCAELAAKYVNSESFIRSTIDLKAIADRYASKVQPAPVNQQMLAALKELDQFTGTPEQWAYHAPMIARAAIAAEAAQPVVQHPDDAAVDSFAAAMKHKLGVAREKGRSGWQQCNPADLSHMLREHVEKGDPRDVANFCMFLWHHHVGIAKQPLNPVLRDKFAGLAMQGMVSSPNCPAHANDHEIARQAYALADAMLAKR